MSISIEIFSENVRLYCAWVESEKHDVLTARQLLLVLMQGIPNLESGERGVGEQSIYSRHQHEDWKAIYQRLSDFPFQFYWEMFSPCDLGETEPVGGDVCDDLADIYGDLWRGLQALEKGDGVYAIKYWRESYFNHWGHHASAAIYAMDEHYRNAANAKSDESP